MCLGFHSILLMKKQVLQTIFLSNFLFSLSHCLIGTWEELIWGVTLLGVMQIIGSPLNHSVPHFGFAPCLLVFLGFFFHSYKLNLSHSSYCPCRQDIYPEQFVFLMFQDSRSWKIIECFPINQVKLEALGNSIFLCMCVEKLFYPPSGCYG